MRKITIVLLALVIMCGCTVSQSRQALLENPPCKKVFTVSKNYQEAYRIIVDRTKNCNSMWIVNYDSVDNQLYTDIQKAEIICDKHSVLLGARTQFSIKVLATGKNTSRVTACYHRGYQKLMQDIQDMLQ